MADRYYGKVKEMVRKLEAAAPTVIVDVKSRVNVYKWAKAFGYRVAVLEIEGKLHVWRLR